MTNASTPLVIPTVLALVWEFVVLLVAPLTSRDADVEDEIETYTKVNGASPDTENGLCEREPIELVSTLGAELSGESISNAISSIH